MSGLFLCNNTTMDKETREILTGKYNADKIEKFGITHYKYKDCVPEDLVVFGKPLHKDCANALKIMRQAAKKDGITLRLISGFRSSEYQIEIFKCKFKGEPTEEELKSRLKYSAPSGYSEHHTGLAVDLNSLEETFEKTKTYKWLCANAQKYGFEMSFPKNNAQNLGYEPWHWRYIGINGENKHIFRQARQNDPRYKQEFS